MTLDTARRVSLLAGAFVLVHCNDPKSNLVEAGPVATVTIFADAAPRASSSSAPTSSDAHVEPRDAGPVRECRVMASDNGPSPSADPTTWLEVADKATFSVRTIDTGRELRFEGPGRVRPCGSDIALVALGSAIGLPSTGEAPGVEQWVATACGVARWASGVHRFLGGRDACRLQTSLGSVHFYVASDVVADELLDGGAPDASAPTADAGAAADPWRRIDTRRAFRFHAKDPKDGPQGKGLLDTPAAVKSALVTCEHAADAVQSLASRMSTPDGGTTGELGSLAAESVTARGIARAACGVAAVRVALGGSRPDDQARLDAASARFRASR